MSQSKQKPAEEDTRTAASGQDAEYPHPGCGGEENAATGKPGRDTLIHQRDLLAAATESAMEAIGVTDAQGQIQYVNSALEQLTGYRRDELIGRPLIETTSLRDGEDLPRGLTEALWHQGSWSGRLNSQRKDMTPFTEECSVSTVEDCSGNTLGMILIRRDITERLRLEAAASEVVNMKNLGAIFSGIRHEIGNPVNSTKSILTLLRTNLERYSTEKILDYLTRAQEKMAQVEYLLRTLKSFNMFEQPEFQIVEIAPLLELLSDLISKDLIDQGIAVETRIEPGAERCRADVRALQQVLLNLMANAADALQGRPEPTIVLQVTRAEERIEISVRDNGQGMTPEQQAKLFRPFQTSKPKGTGLGLILARKLVSAMDGTLTLHSESGQGTTATVTLGGVLEDDD